MPVPERLKRMLESIFTILAAVWILLSVLLYFSQSRFVFYPHKTVNMTPQQIGLVYEDVSLVTGDQVRLHGWFVPHPDPRATLLFFHGNAGNISHRLESLRIFHQLGLAVFIIDYRGYGNSTGTPNEAGTYLDAEAAWAYLTNDRGIPADTIVIFGRSLGGAIAATLAAKKQPAALIIESAFASVYDMGKHYYPYLPIRLLARIKYETIMRLPEITCPLLVVHSTDDDIVPFEQGKKLFEAAHEPKTFAVIQGDHNNGYLESGELYTGQVNAFLTASVKPDRIKQ